jgi:hypothetical protein
MARNPFKKSTWKKVGKDITKAANTVASTVTQAANTVAKETNKAVNVAGKTIVDTAGKVTAEGEKFAKDTANTIAKETVSAAVQAYSDTTKAALQTAKVADQAVGEIEAGAKLTGKILEQGVYELEDTGELIADWVNENYCQIGVSIALGTVFAALLYRPEPSSQATTTAATAPLSATAIAYMAAKETVGAVALGTACDLTAKAFVDLIWMAPDVKKAIGSKNKQILTDAIAFTLAKSIDKAAGAMIVPQSCAAVVAGVVTTLVAQLACEGTLPTGAREWATTGASGL